MAFVPVAAGGVADVRPSSVFDPNAIAGDRMGFTCQGFPTGATFDAPERMLYVIYPQTEDYAFPVIYAFRVKSGIATPPSPPTQLRILSQ
jgi:hypothetical protein